MKKLFYQILPLFIFSLAYSTSFGQTQVQIGDDTFINTSVPMDPYFGYSYTQSIYLASELNGSKNIEWIQWFFSGVTNMANTQDIKIYMGHTTKTEFHVFDEWVSPNNLTLVYDGTLGSPAINEWHKIDLNTMFPYNGVDNLVIAVDENTPGFDDEFDDFLCSPVANDRSSYYRSDITNPDPNDPFAYSSSQTPYVPNVILGSGEPCYSPDNVSITNISDSSFDYSFIPGSSESEWHFELIPYANVPTGTTTHTVNSSSGTLIGLNSGTQYDLYIRSNCPPNTSPWIGPYKITTTTPPIALPYCQDFESGALGTEMAMLTDIHSTASFGNLGGNNGTTGIILSGHSNADGWDNDSDQDPLVWDACKTHISRLNFTVDGTSQSSIALDFDLKVSYTFSLPEYSWFRIMVNGSQLGSVIQASSPTSDPFTTISVDLSAYDGTIFNVSLEHVGKYELNYNALGDNAYIDNLCLTSEPCPTPQNVNVNLGTDPNRVVISWDPVPAATAYQVRYRRVLTTAWTNVTTSTNSKAITGLVQNKIYDYRVRSKCGDTWSNMTPIVKFRTVPCDAPSGLFSTQLSSNKVRVEWASYDYADKYQIWYRLAGSSDNWNSLVTYQLGMVARVISNLAPGATYEWKVRSFCEITYGPWTDLEYFTNAATREKEDLSAALSISSVYPNPASEMLNIDFNSENDTPIGLQVIDVMGRVVHHQEVNIQRTVTIDVSNLENGYYILKMTQGDNIVYKKFVKK